MKSFCNMMETRDLTAELDSKNGRKRVEIWIIRHLFQSFAERELEKYDSIQKRNSFRIVFCFFSDGRNKSMFTCYRNDLTEEKIGPNSH